MTARSLSTALPRKDAVLREGAWWLLVLIACAVTAQLTLIDARWGCTLALLVLTGGLHLRSRAAGLVCVWAIWLLAPGLRRMLGEATGYSDADPLALAPFLATALVGVLELRRAGLSRGARLVLAAALGGYAIGVPMGLVSPEAMVFGLFAYSVGVLAFVLGYGEPLRGGLTLEHVLLLVVPLLAVYGIWQYFDLPSWDATWLETVEFVTAGAPEEDRVRVFATLNSPGTFGMVLGITALGFLTLRRLGPLSLLGLALVLAGLGLTYVRGAWGALALSAIGATLLTRGRMLPRLVLVLALMIGGLLFSAARSTTGAAIVDRINTFGSLSQDESSNARIATPQQLVPDAVARPAGAGIGSAGEASRLREQETFRYTDNAYLSLLYQIGPFGFVLVMGAIAAGMRRAWRSARASPRGTDLLVFAVLAFILVACWSGDLLYGVTGIVFWYLLGVAWRRDDMRARLRTERLTA
jgi:putative inorganic carbon (HCO3(-)) transporter